MSRKTINLLHKYNIKLTKQQLEAVSHRDGAAMVLSCPGSGKTTIIVCRIANLLLNHALKPENILTVTFSRAAAHDMKQRFINTFTDIDSSKLHFSTIHSFANAVTREFASKTGRRFERIEGDDARISKISLLKQIYYEVNDEYINEDKLEELSGAVSYVKNMMLTEQQFNEHSKNIDIKNFNNIYINYETIKRDRNFIDFDDMLSKAVHAFKNDPSLLKRYQDRFSYIQVDEGQDTSRLQHELIRLLASRNKNIFIVADDDQSIYGFRGAFPKFLLGFETVYPEAKTFRMEENFRSTPEIVSCANDFINENTSRFQKNMITKNGAGSPIEIVMVNDEDEQINKIIRDLKSAENPSDYAILYRNNISAIYLADIFERKGIPFYLRDYRQSFFKHWVVQDIASFLRLSLDNTDIESFERIYYKMNSYVSKRAIEMIKGSGDNTSVFRLLRQNGDLQVYQNIRLSNLETLFKALSFKSPLDAICMIENELNYKSYLEDNSKGLGYSLDGLNNVISTLKLIAGNTRSIIDFLVRIESLPGILEEAKHNRFKNAVTLSTIHSAKGLEFENVLMIDLIDGQFPSNSSIELFDKGSKQEMEEERRVFYVGMTRARKLLKLFVPGHKNNESCVISRFVGEVFGIIGPPGEDLYPAGRDEFHTGNIIDHKVFGRGRILKISGNIIEANFNECGKKSLVMDICIENGIIKKVE